MSKEDLQKVVAREYIVFKLEESLAPWKQTRKK